MRQLFSYLIGILVAALIVFGLHFGMYVGSPAFARQVSADRAAGKSLDEQYEMLQEGTRDEKIVAITAIGQGDDDIDRRVAIIAHATASTDKTIKSICALSVQRLGDRVKPGVRMLLNSDDPVVVRRACGVIRALGTEGDEFADAVLDLLKNGDGADRHAAMYALETMNPAKIVGGLDAVISELDDENFNTQCGACFVLRNLGRSAEPAVERLVQLLQEGNVSTRTRAAQALAAIGPVAGYDIPGLLAERLTGVSHTEKVRVLDALGALGPDASLHLDEVEELMQNPKHNCSAEAALAYYRISGDADPALKKLISLLARRNTRMAAIECLGGMGEEATDAVPELTDFLGSKDLATAETAILSLKRIGPTAAEALPRLRKMVKHDDFLISVAAQEAIAAISDQQEK